MQRRQLYQLARSTAPCAFRPRSSAQRTTAASLISRTQAPRAQLSSKRHYGSSSRGRGAEIASNAGNALIIGSVLTLFGYIVYTLYDNMISEHGTTRVYNESLDLIRANPQIRELFGQSVAGFGEPTHSQRQRQRSIAHRLFEDKAGRQRLTMQYYIQDSKKESPYLGVAKMDLVESKGTKSWDYNYIVVDLYLKDRIAALGMTQGGLGEKAENVGAVGRVEVLVTDEFAKEVREFEAMKRNQKFSAANKGSSDGSWFSVLHPSNWRK
ncbi:hypothetical protein GQ54DRAFT_297570 [Martensiomyces pterosporus]|nr:hypothetical protein GQ54DRAFT_297570 [Martensiomyces pterosporus]